MRIYDIAVPLSADLPAYPGDPFIRVNPWSKIEDGDAANVSRLTLSSHSGTHLDAPRHFIDGGLTVDEIPLDLLLGPALVAEIPGPHLHLIGPGELARLPLKGVERVLLKTHNSLLWHRSSFTPDFASLSVEGAKYLIEAGVKLVGIDYLSIERFEGDGTVHRTLLENGVIILEGLNLEEVPPQEYELICLPLRIRGGDGAPARVLLRGPAPQGEGTSFDPHTTRWPLS